MKKLYKYCLSLLLTTSMALAISLSTTNDGYKSVNDVTLNINGTLSGNNDWVGIYRVGASNDTSNVLAYSWVKGRTTNLKIDTRKDTIKSLMELSRGGDFEARLFFNGSYKSEASTKFYLTASTGYELLIIEPLVPEVGDTINVAVNTVLSGNKDWIGLYKVGDDNSWDNVVAWNWVTKPYGDVSLTKGGKTTSAGDYEVRLFFNNSYKVETHAGFQISKKNRGTINTRKQTYNVNESISLDINMKLSGNKDWVGIYKKGDDNSWSNVIAWNWVTKSGIVTITKGNTHIPAGEYEARLFFNNSYNLEAMSTFSIKDSEKDHSTTVLISGESENGTANKDTYQYYKIYAHAGDRVKVDLTNMDANGNLYVKAGSQASIDIYDCKSENGGKTHSAEDDGCSVQVNKDGYVYMAVYAPSYGCYTNVNHTIVASVGAGGEYNYGKMGNLDVEVTKYSKDAKAVIYHPSTWKDTPTPVIFFSPGWGMKDHNSYKTLFNFIASHGYSVIFVPHDNPYREALKLDAVVNEFKDKLNTKKIGLVGHSSGGGYVFYLLEHMIAKNYGNQGRFMMSLDGYIAQYMDKKNMQNLTNTNILLMQLGTDGLKAHTDPRTVITNYRLLTGAGIDKNYIVLKENYDHMYPARDSINKMQDMLKPLDALMEYTFKQKLASHHAMALEGSGKIDPLINKYQIVLPIKKYGGNNERGYGCHYANSWQYGADRKTKTTIIDCGMPDEIQPN